jgi:DNA ligase 4
MRLLLPQLDRERGNYGLKESTLAKYYAEILLLPQNEAERLKHWKNPIKQVEGVVAGDFVGVLMSVMRKRARQDGSKLTINGLNQQLD